jgi:hypothetical protein
METTDRGKELLAMQEVTSGPAAPAGGWGATRGARIAAALAGLGGALAIAGALLPWVSVTHGKKSEVLHGTSFSVGTLTLIAGIVLVACAVVWLAVASLRARLVLAVVAVAASAAMAVAIGAGLGTKAFLNQGATKAKHHQRSGKNHSGSNPTASATGAVYIPNRPGQADAAGTPVLTAARASAGFVAQADAGKGKKNRKAVTSTLEAGVFISLAGGILGLIAGLWLLLASSGKRAAAGPSGEPAATGPPAPEAPSATETAVPVVPVVPVAPAGPIAADPAAMPPAPVPVPSGPAAPAEAETTQLPAVSPPAEPVGPVGPTEPTVQMKPAVDDEAPSAED